jgi:hypothetical protein
MKSNTFLAQIILLLDDNDLMKLIMSLERC